MPNNAYKRRGIAGVPGRNLNSVRGSLDISGLYPVRMRQDGSPREGEGANAEAQLQQFIDFQAGTRASSTPTLKELQTREDFFKTYLGDSGYEQERETSQKNAKLQAALALAQAGFGLMGAQPREGESPMSVMGRAFGAPLAERMGAISGTFAERDAARRAAQRAEERQIKLQAFQDVTSRKQAEATRHDEQRQSAWEAISSGTSILKNQQTKIGGVWIDVGQIRRDMKGPFMTDPEYTSVATGEKITTPIRDFTAPTKGYQDKITKLPPIEVWVSRSTEEDPNAGEWVDGMGYTQVEFDAQGGRKDSSMRLYGTNETIRFQDVVVKRDGVTQTLKANARFVRDDDVDTEFEALRFVVKKGDDGEWVFTDADNPVQVRQTKETDNPINIRTLKPYVLGEGEVLLTVDQLPKALQGVATGDDIGVHDAGKAQQWVKEGDKLVLSPVVVDTKVKEIDGVLSQVRVDNDKPITIGSAEGDYQLYEKPGEVSATRESRRNALYSRMPEIQARQRRGDFSTYSARSALYFDQSLYREGLFPFKYVVDPTDRSQDRVIEDPVIQNLILNKLNSLADYELKTDFGDVNQQIKSERIAKAVKSMLSVPAEILFGAKPIPSLGYEPRTQEISGAANRVLEKTVAGIMRENADADAFEEYSVIAYPDNNEAMNATSGRMRVATGSFPEAFGFVGEPGTGNFDAELAQRRFDTEAGLRNAVLRVGATPEDHRAVLQTEAAKIAKDRTTEQNKVGATYAIEEVRLRLEFRRALLDFKNAAAETNVEGFWTGTLAKIAATVGFADFIAGGEGAEHWERLTAASEKLAQGLSRRVGRDYGDDRISNYDAQAYQKLLASIEKGGRYNAILVEDSLGRLNREITGYMQIGGKVAYSESLLKEVAEAGVDFSKLRTQMNWHGYGYYGNNRYAASRQPTPSLSQDQYGTLRSSGQLKDTLYGGQYMVPMIDYAALTSGEKPRFTLGAAETETSVAVDPTKIRKRGPYEFERFVAKQARDAGVDVDVMRKLVEQAVVTYYNWRDVNRVK